MSTTKERICQTAYELFRKRGYDNVTVNDICTECNIAKTTFYYHIPSKDSILYNFYNAVADSVSLRFKDILGADNYWQQLVLCYEALLSESEQLGYELTGKLYCANINKNQNSIRFRNKLDDLFILIIKKAQDAGQILNTSPAADIYKAFGYTYIGLEVFWSIERDKFDRRKELLKSLENTFNVHKDYRILPNSFNQ